VAKDIEITFGKFVIIEKISNDFIDFISPVCKVVPNSALHMCICGTYTATIIRYAPLTPESNIFIIRALRISKVRKEYLYINDTLPSTDNNFLRETLYAVANAKHTVKIMLQGKMKIQLLDSTVYACHKESLGELIIKFSKDFNNVQKIKYQFQLSDCEEIVAPYHKILLDECVLLYGQYNTEHQLIRHTTHISDHHLKALKRDINNYLKTLKRKGRRLLSKSIHLNV